MKVGILSTSAGKNLYSFYRLCTILMAQPGYLHHRSLPGWLRKRHQQASGVAQRLDPQGMRMSKTGMDDYYVSPAAYIAASVTVDYLNIAVFPKICSGSLNQLLVTINGKYPPLHAHHF